MSVYTFSTLANFNGANGSAPEAGLTVVGSQLYGTTSGGGSSGLGSVFDYNLGRSPKNVSRLHSLASFNGANGDTPEDGLTYVGGNLYCATDAHQIAGGSVAEYNPTTKALTNVALMPQSPDPDPNDHPMDGLINVGGNLYGDTDAGDDAFLYECNLSTHSITSLANLGSSRGAEFTDLLNVGGNLYGTVATSGEVIATKTGAIFEYNLATHKLTTRFSFDGTDGTLPAAGLINVGGNLYGTTVGGGAHGMGTVYEFNPTTGLLTTLGSFNGTNGSYPTGNLSYINGNLFGSTNTGGYGKDGTVFEYNLTSKSLSAVASFNGANGFHPNGFLTSVNGTIYGTTEFGGASNNGTVFSLTPLVLIKHPIPPVNLIVPPLSPMDLQGQGNGAKPIGELVIETPFTNVTDATFGNTTINATAGEFLQATIGENSPWIL